MENQQFLSLLSKRFYSYLIILQLVTVVSFSTDNNANSNRLEPAIPSPNEHIIFIITDVNESPINLFMQETYFLEYEGKKQELTIISKAPELSPSGGEYQFRIDVGNLPAGYYSITSTDNKRFATYNFEVDANPASNHTRTSWANIKELFR